MSWCASILSFFIVCLCNMHLCWIVKIGCVHGCMCAFCHPHSKLFVFTPCFCHPPGGLLSSPFLPTRTKNTRSSVPPSDTWQRPSADDLRFIIQAVNPAGWKGEQLRYTVSCFMFVFVFFPSSFDPIAEAVTKHKLLIRFLFFFSSLRGHDRPIPFTSHPEAMQKWTTTWMKMKVLRSQRP